MKPFDPNDVIRSAGRAVRDEIEREEIERMASSRTSQAMARQLREAIQQCMTQEHFAKLVGTSTGRVSEVLAGKAPASVGAYDEWAAALGCHWHIELRSNGTV